MEGTPLLAGTYNTSVADQVCETLDQGLEFPGSHAFLQWIIQRNTVSYRGANSLLKEKYRGRAPTGQDSREGWAVVWSDLLWVFNIVSASFKFYKAGLLLSMLTQLNEAQLDQRIPAFHILTDLWNFPSSSVFLPHEHLKALRNLYYWVRGDDSVSRVLACQAGGPKSGGKWVRWPKVISHKRCPRIDNQCCPLLPRVCMQYIPIPHQQIDSYYYCSV